MNRPMLFELCCTRLNERGHRQLTGPAGSAGGRLPASRGSATASVESRRWGRKKKKRGSS